MNNSNRPSPPSNSSAAAASEATNNGNAATAAFCQHQRQRPIGYDFPSKWYGLTPQMMLQYPNQAATMMQVQRLAAASGSGAALQQQYPPAMAGYPIMPFRAGGFVRQQQLHHLLNQPSLQGHPCQQQDDEQHHHQLLPLTAAEIERASAASVLASMGRQHTAQRTPVPRADLLVPLRDWINIESSKKDTLKDILLRKTTVAYGIAELLEKAKMVPNHMIDAQTLQASCFVDNFVVRIADGDLSRSNEREVAAIKPGSDIIGVEMVSPQISCRIFEPMFVPGEFFDETTRRDEDGRTLFVEGMFSFSWRLL